MKGFFQPLLFIVCIFSALTRVKNILVRDRTLFFLSSSSILDLFLIITYPKHVVYTMTNSNRCKICMPQNLNQKRHKKKKGRK